LCPPFVVKYIQRLLIKSFYSVYTLIEEWGGCRILLTDLAHSRGIASGDIELRLLLVVVNCTVVDGLASHRIAVWRKFGDREREKEGERIPFAYFSKSRCIYIHN